MDDSVKQVIVIRHDLHMRQGKAIAQGAHAAMMFLIHAPDGELTETEQRWFSEGITKICVRAESAEQLQAIIQHSKNAGVKVFSVMDAGRTEFQGVPTMTCCAIGPDIASRIDPITGSLKLM